MADPFSITAGVLTLMPQVKEGFVLVKDVFVTDRKSRFYEGRVELQRTLFQAWEDCWTDSRGGPDKNFRDFAIVKPLSAKSTLQQLVLLLRTFTDPEKLKVKYGLAVEKPGALQRFDDLVVEMKYVSSYLYTISNNFSAKDAAMLEENQARHMDLFRKIRFTLSGSDKEIEDLIWRLDEFNRNLRILTTRTIGETANRRLFELAVKDIMGDVDHTRRLAEAATYEAKQSIDEEAKEKYDDLAKFGNFSLAIKFATAEMSRRKIFSRTDFSFDSPYELNPHATLARLFDYPTKYQSRLVLIEWVTLSRSSSIRENLDAMKITWYVLHAEKPEKLLLPATIGLIYEETEPRKIGIVFQLPPHIRGNLPTKPVVGRDGWMGPRVVRSPKAIAAQRMPITLRQLIQKKEIKGIDLGIRFQLAKRLLDAIHLMHTAGWIHTNIRPDNILFFPSASRSSGDPDPDALDYTRPLLVGFHDARLQVTFTPDVPPHQRNPHQPEGLKPILKNAPNRPQPRDVVIDCYQHPERRLGATNGGGASGRGAGGGGAGGGGGGPFRRQYDLYSVGCVLLELGLWETLDGAAGREVAARACRVGEAAREEDVWMDAETVRKLAKGLDVITGSIYAEVTRKCLSLSPVTGDIVEFERGLAATLAQIAA